MAIGRSLKEQIDLVEQLFQGSPSQGEDDTQYRQRIRRETLHAIHFAQDRVVYRLYLDKANLDAQVRRLVQLIQSKSSAACQAEISAYEKMIEDRKAEGMAYSANSPQDLTSDYFQRDTEEIQKINNKYKYAQVADVILLTPPFKRLELIANPPAAASTIVSEKKPGWFQRNWPFLALGLAIGIAAALLVLIPPVGAVVASVIGVGIAATITGGVILGALGVTSYAAGMGIAAAATSQPKKSSQARVLQSLGGPRAVPEIVLKEEESEDKIIIKNRGVKHQPTSTQDQQPRKFKS